QELQTMATSSPYLFPNERAPKSQPMARDTLSKALRSMGYQGRVTPHRFRTTFKRQHNLSGGVAL
ncbi:MAG: hypothetical protein ABIT70_03450, partial [Sulfuriferula sp.]